MQLPAAEFMEDTKYGCETPVALKLVQLSHHKHTLITAAHYSLGYQDAKHPVFDKLSFEVCQGDLPSYCQKKNLDKSLFFAILRQLDFDRVQFTKPMEEYSEGQKKKVLLATSLLTPAHLYIWDEPLNYIDVFSRIQIEELLLTYHPTMVFVEHDAKFCEKIATKTVSL